MASRTGAVCGGGDRRVGPVGDGEELSGHRLGWLSSGLVVGTVGLRLCDRGGFVAQARAGELPRCRRADAVRRPASRLPLDRALSPPPSGGARRAVRAGAAAVSEGWSGEARHARDRRHQAAGERLAPQGDELRADGQGRDRAGRRDRRAPRPGRGAAVGGRTDRRGRG